MFSTITGHTAIARQRPHRTVATSVARIACIAAADMLRMLVFLLVGLLGLCAGLMCLTGQYDMGSLVIGSVLFIGLAAANWAR